MWEKAPRGGFQREGSLPLFPSIIEVLESNAVYGINEDDDEEHDEDETEEVEVDGVMLTMRVLVSVMLLLSHL